MDISLSPFAPENLVSRDGFGRPVPRQPAHSPHSICIWCLLTGFLPISAAASINLYHHTPSGQSRVYWVTQLRSDGVYYRESAGSGPVVFKIVPVTGDAWQVTTKQSMCASPLFSHTHYLYGVGMWKVSTRIFGSPPSRSVDKKDHTWLSKNKIKHSTVAQLMCTLR